MDQTPFKEHYQHIPSHMYDDVRAHIHKMLDISAIWKSHNPWASAVVLVWKKDGSLRFCIDLRKLNTMGPLGFYESDRMPFRLTNAPATFQRLMETCFGHLNLHWCIIYLDDIVIFSNDPASHLERLKAVL